MPQARLTPQTWLIAGVVAFIALYALCDLNKFYALRYGADTGCLEQTLLNFWQSGTTVNGYENRPHLAVHATWSLLVLAPFVAAIPFTETLLAVKLLAVALAAIPLYAFARAAGLSRGPAVALALAYLIAPTTQSAAYSNVTENAFVPLAAFSLALAVQRRNDVATFVLALLLIGLKEDEALFVGWFAAIALVLAPSRRKIAALILALSAADFAGYQIVEHAVGYASARPAYGYLPQHPLDVIVSLAAMLAPLAFAPLLLGWRMLFAIPLIAEISINGPWTVPLYGVGSHYTYPLVALMTIGAVIAATSRPRFGYAALALSGVVALVAGTTVMRPGRAFFVLDRSALATAQQIRESGRTIVLPGEGEGIYALAAPNLRVSLSSAPAATVAKCPGYNHNGRAFLASVGWGTWPSGVTLCGGAVVRAPGSTADT